MYEKKSPFGCSFTLGIGSRYWSFAYFDSSESILEIKGGFAKKKMFEGIFLDYINILFCWRDI